MTPQYPLPSAIAPVTVTPMSFPSTTLPVDPSRVMKMCPQSRFPEMTLQAGLLSRRWCCRRATINGDAAVRVSQRPGTIEVDADHIALDDVPGCPGAEVDPDHRGSRSPR